MGQIVVPGTPPSIILSAVDRLVASNADGGVSPLASHIILLGENAGHNLAESNVIALGAFSLDAGVIDPTLDGSIGIGVNAGGSIVGPSSNVNINHNEGMIFIGKSAGALLQRGDESVILGAHALETMTGVAPNDVTKAVIIGAYAMSDTPDLAANNVIAIGYRALGGATLTTLVDTIAIGSGIAQSASGVFSGNTVIGSSAAGGANGALGNVIIGTSAGNGLTGANNNVMIGATCSMSTGDETIVIGKGANAGSGNQQVVLGALNQTDGDLNIVIGYRAAINTAFNINGGANGTSFFLVGNVNNAHLFGNMARGDLLIGNSNAAQGVPYQGANAPTNAVGLIDGTPGTNLPVLGGFFYALAGEAHWMSSAGVDTTLTPGVTLAANNTFTGLNTLSSAEPRLRFAETGVAANQGLWDIDVNASVMSVRTRTDADGAGEAALVITRGVGTNITTTQLVCGTTILGLDELGGGLEYDTDFAIAGGTLTIDMTGGFNASGSAVQVLSTGPTIVFDSQGNNGSIIFQCTGTGNGNLQFTATGTGNHSFQGGNVRVSTAGRGLRVAEGSNAKQGVATLVGGTAIVANTSVTANSRIFLTCQSLGTVAVPSALCISARTAGTSFTILASAPTDTSVIAWEIFEPA